jgi:hypothetical protein
MAEINERAMGLGVRDERGVSNSLLLLKRWNTHSILEGKAISDSSLFRESFLRRAKGVTKHTLKN